MQLASEAELQLHSFDQAGVCLPSIPSPGLCVHSCFHVMEKWQHRNKESLVAASSMLAHVSCADIHLVISPNCYQHLITQHCCKTCTKSHDSATFAYFHENSPLACLLRGVVLLYIANCLITTSFKLDAF